MRKHPKLKLYLSSMSFFYFIFFFNYFRKNDHHDNQNEKSLTIPNESSFRDEKLDNKVPKNILEFSKTKPVNSKKFIENNQNEINKKPYITKNNLNYEKILTFSDSFSKYTITADKEKQNKVSQPKTIQKIIKNEIEEKNFLQKKPELHKNQNSQIYSSSINTVTSLIQNSLHEKRAQNLRNNEKSAINDSNSTDKQSLESNLKKPNESHSYKKNYVDLSKNTNFYSKTDLTSISSSNQKYKDERLDITEKNLEYYSKNGIFKSLPIEKSDSFYLYEILENTEFSFYICESIKEQKDELKLFLTTSSTHYKTSKRILLLNTCRFNFRIIFLQFIFSFLHEY